MDPSCLTDNEINTSYLSAIRTKTAFTAYSQKYSKKYKKSNMFE